MQISISCFSFFGSTSDVIVYHCDLISQKTSSVFSAYNWILNICFNLKNIVAFCYLVHMMCQIYCRASWSSPFSRSYSWPWCFFCQHSLWRDLGSWEGWHCSLSIFSTNISFTKILCISCKYGQKMRVALINCGVVILYFRLICGWERCWWNEAMTYIGWRVFYLLREWMRDLSFRLLNSLPVLLFVLISYNLITATTQSLYVSETFVCNVDVNFTSIR